MTQQLITLDDLFCLQEATELPEDLLFRTATVLMHNPPDTLNHGAIVERLSRLIVSFSADVSKQGIEQLLSLQAVVLAFVIQEVQYEEKSLSESASKNISILIE